LHQAGTALTASAADGSVIYCGSEVLAGHRLPCVACMFGVERGGHRRWATADDTAVSLVARLQHARPSLLLGLGACSVPVASGAVAQALDLRDLSFCVNQQEKSN
jgi:hypothetical protein